MTIAILCSLFIVVFAVTNSNTEAMTTPLAGNPFEYARVPDAVWAITLSCPLRTILRKVFNCRCNPSTILSYENPPAEPEGLDCRKRASSQ